MTVRSRDVTPREHRAESHRPAPEPPRLLPPPPPQTGQRAAAVIAGAGSFATTLLFVWAIGVDFWWGIGVAVLIEFVLMQLKRVGGPAAWTAHGIDTLLNGGGLFPYVLQLDKTPTWAMLVTGLGLEGGLRNLPALVLALAVGLGLSIAPLALWRGRRRKR